MKIHALLMSLRRNAEQLEDKTGTLVIMPSKNR